MLNRLFKHKFIEYGIYGILGSAILTAAVAVYWSAEDPHMIKVNNAKSSENIDNGTAFIGIPVRPSQVHPGEFVLMHLDYCKLKNVDGAVTARLVGQKFITRLNWPNDRSQAGCIDAEVPIPIPENANDDTYYIEFEVLYHVNPLKDRDVILRSDVFKINQ